MKRGRGSAKSAPSWIEYLDRRPIVVAIAGPNGAGKSTFSEAHLKSSGLRFLNTDAVAKELTVDAYEAARMMAALRTELVNLLDFLEAGQPAMLQVDMGYLPYFDFGQEYHFGYHVIVVAGFDPETRQVLVADRDQELHTVSWDDLREARASTWKPFPPRNRMYRYDFSGFHPPEPAEVILSLREPATPMLEPPITNIGNQGIRKAAGRVVKWPESMGIEELRRACFNCFIFIDATGGTGGGLFRYMYGRYLIEAAGITDEETARLYLGGKGYGTRLLYDLTPAGIDPLGPANPLIFATGPLNGSVAPQSNRFAVVCKSPLTGGIGNAACGGSFAYGLKRSGVDVLVIRNQSASPVRIDIDGDRSHVAFIDASDLWGKGTGETQEVLGRKKHHAVIGPDGEHLVLFAGIVSNERIAARTGVGAVMGSKRLKAVTAGGSRRLEMDDERAFKEYTTWVGAMFKRHPVLGDRLKRVGTSGIVSTTNPRNILPTRNFKYGHHPDALNVSGEYMADHALTGVKSSCIHCPVTCGRDVELEGAGRVKGPEYETVALLGTNLDLPDLKHVAEWNHLADELGMDTISLGAVIGFAMELRERGLLDAGVRFGDPSGVSDLIGAIAHRRGLGHDLADAVRRMSETYGGRPFAMHVKGLELSA